MYEELFDNPFAAIAKLEHQDVFVYECAECGCNVLQCGTIAEPTDEEIDAHSFKMIEIIKDVAVEIWYAKDGKPSIGWAKYEKN